MNFQFVKKPSYPANPIKNIFYEKTLLIKNQTSSNDKTKIKNLLSVFLLRHLTNEKSIIFSYTTEHILQYTFR